MDETIGVKGGHNDRLRSLRISQALKEKLQEHESDYIKELEKKVKRQQKYTLIKTIPIVVTGTIINNLFGIGDYEPTKEDISIRYKEQGDIDEQEERIRVKKELEKRKRVITLPSGTKVVVYIPVQEEKENESLVEIKPLDVKKTSKEKTGIEGNTTLVSIPQPKKGIDEPIINDSLLEEIEKDLYFEDIDFNNLPEESKEKLSKLRSRRIIDYYEEKLKEIRYDLRQTIYDYNVLVYDEDGIVLSKDAETILDKLTDIISRIEELKKRINIEDLDKYDDNYIYVLIEDYLSEFRDQKLVKEIKDSPLYVEISKKLDELETKRDSYSKKIEKKQEELVSKEEDFEELKKKYYSIDKINQELKDIQKEQERILASLKEKVAKSTSTYERVEYEMQAMTRGTRRMMRLLTLQMFLPGPRFAKSFATTSAAYLYFLNNIYRPNLRERKIRVIQVEDYSREISNSIETIDDASKLLGKTSSQIDKMIKELKEKYGDYKGVISEFDNIIYSLNKIKIDIEEKEYEMKKIRKEQELVLERNNAKVLTRGEYPVN